MTELVFWVCAVISIVSALLVVTRRNPIYSALFLLVCFLSFAVLFIQLWAPFLAAMHVMVYTGAILVLFLFVIMLLNLKKEELGKEFSLRNKAFLALLSVGLFSCILFILLPQKDWLEKSTPPPEGFGSVEAVGQTLFSKFIFPFELLSILIIVAMIGGIVLAKRRQD